jgi:hypothetical protein
MAVLHRLLPPCDAMAVLRPALPPCVAMAVLTNDTTGVVLLP